MVYFLIDINRVHLHFKYLIFFIIKRIKIMNKQIQLLVKPAQITPLTLSEQSHIKGGMAATEEEKRKKKRGHKYA